MEKVKQPTRRELLWEAPKLTLLVAARARPAAAQTGYRPPIVSRWWDWIHRGGWGTGG